MHEVGIVEDLIEELKTQAKTKNATKITKIKVKIGKTEHVTPESFRFWFDKLSKEGIACGAIVEFDTEGIEEGVYLESVEMETDE